MDHFQGKMTVSIMKKRIHLELKMDQEKVEDQLKIGVGPDNEVINFIFALVAKRDSQLCETDGSWRPSCFLETYFMANLLKIGFEFDSGYRYDKKCTALVSKEAFISTG